ncbi:MAG: ATP-dependent sacrificial sulfur transferase LarE [Desulfobacteraceae bacterium]|nr:ATP-dependent sacrificial sulfur transferase LarE [Desulfobacteraceae bacterium]
MKAISTYFDKIEHLDRSLKGMKKIALAFSGGVDSHFLLASAKRAGLEKLLAITVSSQFFTEEEKDRAKKLADSLGVDYICLDLDILGQARVVQNTPRRCYFCKAKIFSLIRETAIQNGIDTWMHAVNVDDLGDYRPGLEAAKELGFIAPLVEAGFSKKEIRACSKHMGLGTWDLPSQSCLATRIPYDDPITREKLEMVDQGESFLRKLGFNNFRVRCHGTLARIEMDTKLIASLMEKDKRRVISRGLKKIGFKYVSWDLDGYKTGNMNP